MPRRDPHSPDKPTADTDRLLTVPEVADYLRISRDQAYLTVRARGFPLIELGPNMLRIRRQDLDRWLSERTAKN
jgi:excisionase family DNA binding protein